MNMLKFSSKDQEKVYVECVCGQNHVVEIPPDMKNSTVMPCNIRCACGRRHSACPLHPPSMDTIHTQEVVTENTQISMGVASGTSAAQAPALAGTHSGGRGINPLAAICYLISTVSVFMGLYKMFVYDNSRDAVNVYVGGDAYNYIINANYATGYFVLSLLFAIIGGTILILDRLNYASK